MLNSVDYGVGRVLSTKHYGILSLPVLGRTSSRYGVSSMRHTTVISDVVTNTFLHRSQSARMWKSAKIEYLCSKQNTECGHIHLFGINK